MYGDVLFHVMCKLFFWKVGLGQEFFELIWNIEWKEYL